MKNKKPKKPDYLKEIIKFLQMDAREFMARVISDEPYETTMYFWINECYKEAVPVKDAIQLINDRRLQSLFETNKQFSVAYDTERNLRAVMESIEKEPGFIALSTKEKYRVRGKTEALVETSLYRPREVLAMILKIIGPLPAPEKPKKPKKKESDPKGLKKIKDFVFQDMEIPGPLYGKERKTFMSNSVC